METMEQIDHSKEAEIVLVGNSMKINLPNGETYFKNLSNFSFKIGKALSLLKEQEEAKKQGLKCKMIPIKTYAIKSVGRV